MSEEVEVLVETPREYKTVTGEVLTLPAITWGREIRVLRVIKDILKETINSGLLKPEVDSNGNVIIESENTSIAKLLALLFETAPDRITEAASALTGKDKKWVEENLVSETILEVLVPFLRSKQDSILKTLQPYLVNVQTETN